MGNEPSHMDDVQNGKKVVNRELLAGHHVDWDDATWKDPFTCCWTLDDGRYRVTLEDGQVLYWKTTKDHGCGFRLLVITATKLAITILYTPVWLCHHLGCFDKKEEKQNTEQAAIEPPPPPADAQVTLNPLSAAGGTPTGNTAEELPV